MARLRQLYQSRYGTTAAVNSEFENVVRYINSAEIGNNMISELLSKLFDSNGEVSLGVEMRFNASTGVEYRFAADGLTADEGWELAATAAEVRGPSGSSVGNIDSPVFYNRVDAIATGGQTVFPYTFSGSPTGILVYKSGLLLAASEYTFSTLANTVTLSSGALIGNPITIYSVRSTEASSYRRTDFVATASQSAFSFPHSSTEQLLVYRSGVLQRAGGAFDYTTNSTTGIVTFVVPQTLGIAISVIAVDTPTLRAVVGLMLEDAFCTGGLIRYDRVAVADGQIPQAKVSGLAAALAATRTVTVGSTDPVAPADGDLWVYTGDPSNPILRYFVGSTWFADSLSGLVPTPGINDALKFVRVSADGRRLEYVPYLASGYLVISQRGASNGVASLDAGSKVPMTQIPEEAVSTRMGGAIQGAITDGTYPLFLSSGEILVLNRFAVVAEAGTCTAQLKYDSTSVGATISVSTTPALMVTQVSGSSITTPVKISLVITGASGCSGLSWSVNKRSTLA